MSATQIDINPKHESWTARLSETFRFDDVWAASFDILRCGLSVRLSNCLTKAGLTRLDQVLGKSPAELMTITNFGIGTLRELCLAIAACENIKPPATRGIASVKSVLRSPTSLTLLHEWELFGGDPLFAQWLGVGVLEPSENSWDALEGTGIELLAHLLSLTICEAQDVLGNDVAAELLDLIPVAALLTRELARRRRSASVAVILSACSNPPIRDLGLSGRANRRLAGWGSRRAVISC